MLKDIYFKSIITALTITLLFASCQDVFWAEHYKLSPLNSDKTLMQEMESDTSLTRFVNILKNTGYDKILNGSQTYTVWAPTNTALGSIIVQDTVAQFLKNHIARFPYSTADLAQKGVIRVKMLNGKANTFLKNGNDFTFGDANVIAKDIVTQNGVLLKINKYVPFFENIWEKVKSFSGNDSISNYLYSFDKKVFDAANSTELGTSSKGILYDSVFVYSNAWLSKFGRLNLEDSVYTMVVPNNAAWKTAYGTIKSYFKTYDKLSVDNGTTKTFKITGTLADSLQRTYTCQALTHDLAFRTKLTTIPADSLISTNKNVFHSPSHLFDNSVPVETSNGLIYSSGSMSYLPTESWHKRIVVEAENSAARTYNNASVVDVVAKNDQFIPYISGRKYTSLTPTGASANFQPELILNIPNTLSAAYDIYCVVVPKYESDTSKTYFPTTKTYSFTDSTMVSFQMTYVDANGLMSAKTSITKDPVTAKVYETSPTNVSKFLVAKGFKFPFANFTISPFTGVVIQTNTVTIKVKTNVSSTDFTSGKYVRNLRVDCFILEPAN